MSTVPIAVWKCQCGLAFLHPVPTADQLPEQGDWWSHGRQRFRRRRSFKKFWKKFRMAIVGTGKQRLIRATRKAMPNGRFLDVGCGKGRIFDDARKYYEYVGLEPSAAGAQLARERGIEVIQNTLEEAEIEPGSFDVVLLDSVIEHVPNPVSFLKRVNAVLKKGGVVVVLTPKLNGPAHFMHGAGWNGFRHGYHTFLFTGDTLERCLLAAGFAVLQSPRRDRLMDDILILWGKKISEVA